MNGSSPASLRSPRPSPSDQADTESAPETSDRRDSVVSVGAQLRASRKAAGISLRQFARDLGVSPSFISQMENGRSQPSVATLYLICSNLGLSIDELFAKAGAAGTEGAADESGPAGSSALRVPNPAENPSDTLAELRARPETAHNGGPVVTPEQRRRLVLDSGVTWEQLSPNREAEMDFLFVRYAVGGSSVANHELTRHSGAEYGYIIRGTLEISLGFETYQVSAGESISFNSSTPHRLTNTGDVPVEAIWFVHGRHSTHDH